MKIIKKFPILICQYFSILSLLSACLHVPCVPAETLTDIPSPSFIKTKSTVPPGWLPSMTDTFQIQLSQYPPDLSVDASVFELDLFETSQSDIASLHQDGKKVICYLNAGAWEEFRPDADKFPDAVLGKNYIGWAGERWLDISNYGVFSSLITARFELAASKGCDGIDADNINGFQHDTGFEITEQDQIFYNIWLSEQAYQRGLAIGMKNDINQVDELIIYFDFAIVEDCTAYNECEAFRLFAEQLKPVFQIEYTDRISTIEDFCSKSTMNGYIGILKNRDLGAWVQNCPLS